jgi:hypothetical protein
LRHERLTDKSSFTRREIKIKNCYLPHEMTALPPEGQAISWGEFDLACTKISLGLKALDLDEFDYVIYNKIVRNGDVEFLS